MHNLAIALKQKGYTVSGSDDEIFEPSRSRLERYDILPDGNGWFPERITDELDYVILGMHAREDNPELQAAREKGLKILSYPEFLYEQSKDKTRVVIAGSHGKTTISAMILHVLHYHDRDIDFMIGAQLEGFEAMVKLTDDNEFILLEGDEYLSSPIDRRPKFLHYHPNIALISGIAWDHVNVFPSFENYREQFAQLLNAIEPGGAVVYNETDEEVVKLVEETPNEVKKFAYSYPRYEIEQNQVYLDSEFGQVPLAVFGRHNMNNLEGARWICNQMGITDEQFYEAITDFKGASRRLERLGEDEQRPVFRDFAHAPSKVAATVAAVRENYPDHKLIACLELHTFSSLNKDFMKQYRGSLGPTDQAFVYFNPKVVAHKKLPAISADDVKQAFAGNNIEVLTDNATLLQRIRQENTTGPQVLLIMSSGSFDGIDWSSFASELNRQTQH